MAEILSTRGPLRVRGSDAQLFSIILKLRPDEVVALDRLPFAQEDLAAAFMTVDFAPRRIRRRANQLGIDYVGTGTAADVAEFCKLAIESKLSQAADT
jgi:hypothetical protein